MRRNLPLPSSLFSFSPTCSYPAPPSSRPQGRWPESEGLGDLSGKRIRWEFEEGAYPAFLSTGENKEPRRFVRQNSAEAVEALLLHARADHYIYWMDKTSATRLLQRALSSQAGCSDGSQHRQHSKHPDYQPAWETSLAVHKGHPEATILISGSVAVLYLVLVPVLIKRSLASTAASTWLSRVLLLIATLRSVFLLVDPFLTRRLMCELGDALLFGSFYPLAALALVLAVSAPAHQAPLSMEATGAMTVQPHATKRAVAGVGLLLLLCLQVTADVLRVFGDPTSLAASVLPRMALALFILIVTPAALHLLASALRRHPGQRWAGAAGVLALALAAWAGLASMGASAAFTKPSCASALLSIVLLSEWALVVMLTCHAAAGEGANAPAQQVVKGKACLSSVPASCCMCGE